MCDTWFSGDTVSRTIIHVDMDAFYASVETRDNPDLVGKPLIIGGKPNERGVVSTCNYEARKYGIHSAMNINEAYRRCPWGIFMPPDIPRYKKVSEILHAIWCDYTDIVQFLSLDEGYLDVTGSLQRFGGAKNIAFQIKNRTKNEVGLTCSVGVGYSMSTAKLASEEKKPDGYFEILTPEFFKNLVIDRSARVISGVGEKTAELLRDAGIETVRDILTYRQRVISLFGKRGQQIVEIANGVDLREVTPYYEAKARSISREETFRQDTADCEYIKNWLLLFAGELSAQISSSEIYAQTVTLKITFGNMKSITRSKSGLPINQARDIYEIAVSLLDTLELIPVRLVGIGISNFTSECYRQLTFEDIK